MLKRRLYEKLKDKLGELLFGFDEKHLDVGYFGGDIHLKDLIFRPKKINEIFEKQNLPFSLKAGMIAKMEIKVGLSLKPFFDRSMSLLSANQLSLLSTNCLLFHSCLIDFSMEAFLRVNDC